MRWRCRLIRSEPVGVARAFGIAGFFLTYGVPACALALIAAAGANPSVEGSAAVSWLAAWAALPFVAFVGWLAARPRQSSGAHEVVVEDEVVRIGGPALSCTFPLSSLTGLLRDEVSGTCIDLTISRRRMIAIDLDNPAEATALIERLGYAEPRRHVIMLDRPLRAVTAPLLSLALAFLAAVPLSIVFLGASEAGWIAVLASLPLIGLAAARLMWPRWIELGADGVLIPGFFRRRLLRYADIDVGLTLGDRVVLSSHSGRRSIVFQSDSTPGRARAVGRLVEEAIGRAQRVVLGSRALPPRGDRPLAVWRAALREAVRGTAGYRAVQIDEDEIDQVLEDARRPLEERLGAALALLEARGRSARARVRAVADASVDHATRELLERAANDELEDALIEQLVPPRKSTS